MRARSSSADLTRLIASRPISRGRLRRVLNAPPTAATTREWWGALSEAERARLLKQVPLLVGNLDGIPWSVRVRANRESLGRAIGALESGASIERALGSASAFAGGEIKSILADASRGELRDRERLVHQLRELHGGRGFVDRGGKPRFVIAFDPERDSIVEYVGAAISESEDPFASPFAEGVTSVGVFVPGNESRLLDFEGKAHTMSELITLAPAGTAGLVVWQGGRFPRGPLALSAAMADGLARKLGGFVNSIPRDGRVELTAFGFSFGGGVTGRAMALGMRVDRVVHVSSAGLGHGVASLDDLPVSARVPHYSLLAPVDPSVGPILGINVHLPFLGRVGHFGHGVDPAHAPGVVRLETGVLGAAQGKRAAGAALSLGDVLTGHSAVLEQWGTTAKRNMVAVLMGGGAEVELAADGGVLGRIAQRLVVPYVPFLRVREPELRSVA
ncbi:hypothetical protein [Pseudoclavibacter sp. VKM Ac-2888]|uniref:hypothetical protein n=1 Tax=Pseudoclavibacter sp. VKM Ac-2888 TaxID=2783830 RepID=UPI00188BCFCF|nr:hypothetical protein [Pseudoclavibacter sp. VKM Ac-2888]MBF4550870.1 hypothetical protein [Pseudoclavibacter sp. VKM Ac-2888]